MTKGWGGLFKKERWSINCDYHNWTLHDLTLNEARACLATLRDTEKATVLIWKTGWPSWRGLRESGCEALLQERKAVNQAPPLPQEDSYDPEITAVRPVSPKNPFLSRKFDRYDVDYPAHVVSGAMEFVTRCMDVSEGGLRVADPLPDWVAGYTTVVLTVEGGRKIELLCSVAEDQKHSKTRFEIVTSEKQPEFLEWFRNHPLFRNS